MAYSSELCLLAGTGCLLWKDVLKNMLKEYSAGAVLFGNFANNERKFLLLHYTSGHWDFPKGNVEAGETETETVNREIFEETGITDIRFVEGFVQPTFYKHRRGGSLVHKKVSFYLDSSNAVLQTKYYLLLNEVHFPNVPLILNRYPIFTTIL